MFRHVSTCINKVVKRSQLFLLDKCCMLYWEKSSPFDQGLKDRRRNSGDDNERNEDDLKSSIVDVRKKSVNNW